MPSLHTLQLSQVEPRRGGMPQVVKIAFWALAAWVFFAGLVWLLAKAL